MARPGFTLIELLVVTVIMGILASVAMPAFGDAQDRARNAATQSNLQVVVIGLEAFAGDHGGRYPQDIDSDPEFFASTTAGRGFFADNYLPGNQMPKSPWHKSPQGFIHTFDACPAAGIDFPLPEPGTPIYDGAVGGDQPTLIVHYGAIAYDTWSLPASAGAIQTAYVVHAIGKKRGKAVVTLSKATRPL